MVKRIFYPAACQILRNVINHMAITNMRELAILNEDIKVSQRT